MTPLLAILLCASAVIVLVLVIARRTDDRAHRRMNADDNGYRRFEQ